MKATEVEKYLTQGLPHQLIQVNTTDEVHFEAIVVSDAFQGESRLTRQRKVYAILGPLMQSGELHALALKTFTPAEWQEEQELT